MRTELPLRTLWIATILICFLGESFLCSTVSAQQRPQGRLLEQPEAVRALPGTGKRWALVIGVDKYRDGQINTLRGSTNDAHMLADALVHYAGFPPDQVILLATDQPEERQPTRINILMMLSNLNSLVPKDGLLLVSFAGHGIERGGQAYLIPSDARLSNDVSLLEESAVSVVRITDRIKATGVGQVIVLLDACRNDPGGRADAPNPLTVAYTRGFNFDVRNHEVQAFATLYATAVGQRAYEYTEKQQGYFTWAVVEGLKGGAANEKGEVTLASLVRYIQETVPKRISIDLGAGKQQRPFAVIEGYRAEDLVISLADKKSFLENSAGIKTAGKQYIENGDKLYKLGRYADAEIEYRLAVRLEPDNPEWQNKLGSALTPQHKFAEAATVFRRALQLDASNPAPYLALLSTANGNNKAELEAQVQEALLVSKEAVRLKPDKPEFQSSLGRALFLTGRFPEAEAAFREAIRLEPNNPEWHNDLGYILLRQGKLAEGEMEFREELRLAPDNAGWHDSLADGLAAQQKYAEAEAEEKRAIQLDPENPEWHAKLWNIYFQKQRYAEAETEIRIAIRAASSDEINRRFFLHLALGQALEAQGKFVEAEAEFREELKLSPNIADTHYGLGTDLLPLQKYAEGEAELREALRLNPTLASNTQFRFGLGIALYAQNKFVEAEAELREAIRLTPTFADAHHRLGYVLLNLKRYAEAEAELREAIRLNPALAGDAQFHNDLGSVLSWEAKWAQAEIELRQATQLDPTNPKYRENLQNVLRAQNK